MSKGGMQSGSLSNQPACQCGKYTSKLLRFFEEDGLKEIAIHFTKKSTYWHTFKAGSIKRTFKKPEQFN